MIISRNLSNKKKINILINNIRKTKILAQVILRIHSVLKNQVKVLKEH